MALGGFSGSDSILTLAELQALIAQGQVRYFYFGFGGGFGGGRGSGNGDLVQWVESTCTAISESSYGGSGGGTLYACSGWARGEPYSAWLPLDTRREIPGAPAGIRQASR